MLISAPAGSGKTSLLAEWISSKDKGERRRGKRSKDLFPQVPYPLSFCWLSLDEDDNDPARFWTYLFATLQSVHPHLNPSALQLLESPQPPPAQSILIPLLNELAGLADPAILVLDDYHVISEGDIHSGMAYLLEHLPAQMQVVIATRADPPLPIHRLRARSQLTEIRQADLRFSLDEAAVYLRDSIGLSLSMEDVAALETRTEGWIAGLHLAGLAMKMPSANPTLIEPNQFIASFTGSHHYILEYLVEEVLSRQSEEVQEFLVRTSILDRLCAELCDEITKGDPGESSQDLRGGRTYGAEVNPLIQTGSSSFILHPSSLDSSFILDFLARSNIFLIPLDESHTWYRYHRLFADLLANRLRQSVPAVEIQRLHRQASAWYAQNELFDEAIQHALAGKDFDKAAAIIERIILSRMFTGGVKTIKSWLEVLPEDIVQTRPRLRMYRGWVYFLQGKLSLSDNIMGELENEFQELPPSAENDRLRLELITILCRNVAMLGDTARAIRLAEEALRKLPEGDRASRARVFSALGIAYGLEGQVEKAMQYYRESLRLTLEIGNYFLAAHTTSVMALGLTYSGQLHEAARFYQSILDLGAKSGQELFYPAGEGYIGLAGIYLEWNDLETAEKYLERGMELCRQGGLAVDLFMGYMTKSRLHQAKGNVQGALAELETLVQTFQPKGISISSAQIGVRKVQLGILSGDLKESAHLFLLDLVGQDDPSQKLPVPIVEMVCTTIIYLYIVQREFKKALEWLDRLERSAGSSGWFGRLIETHLLRALVLQTQAHPTTALVEFKRSLDLAEPEGYVRLYLEKGGAVLPLLNAVIRDPSTPVRLQKYACRLLEAFSGGDSRAADRERSGVPGPDAAPHGEEPDEPIEPLSQRELEILQLICDGYSNQQIAEKLVVSLHTVKKHTSNILAKMGVSSRTQAAARARRLNLL